MEHWSHNLPKSQFQQYGPLNNYFGNIFPDFLVKPQALLRKMLPAPAIEQDQSDDEAADQSFDSYGAYTLRILFQEYGAYTVALQRGLSVMKGDLFCATSMARTVTELMGISSGSWSRLRHPMEGLQLPSRNRMLWSKLCNTWQC